jgi:GNAT superfamily N-acetyltransferase
MTAHTANSIDAKTAATIIATPSEAPALAQLVNGLSHYYLDDPKVQLPDWLSDTLTEGAFAARLADPSYINLVCKFKDEVSGADVIQGYISIKDQSHIYHLFVAEEYQGKGIAKQLWNQARSITQNESFTVRSSLYAVPVYKQFGFVEAGEVGCKDGVSFQPMNLSIQA